MQQNANSANGPGGCLTKLRGVCIGAGLAAVLAGDIANAAVDMRVEARPAAAVGSTSPITVFASVTGAGGAPVGGLTAGNFTVRVDGTTVSSPTFTPPVVAAGSTQRVSVVFAMDYSSSVTDAALPQMQAAVSSFISNMQNGDFASIIKFNQTLGAVVKQPFVMIDGTNTALNNAILTPHAGIGTPLYDAIILSTAQFTTPPVGVTLPAGPKAIVIVSDGGENASTTGSLNSALQAANAAGISIFSIGIGDFASDGGQQLLTTLATQTSGEFYPTPTNDQIDDVYLRVESLLSNEYRLTFPSAISDCNPHTLELTVTGQTAVTDTFTRCVPTFSPDLVGLTRSQAITALTTAGLVLGTDTTASSDTVPSGSVISQSPAGNQQVANGSAVSIVVSSGPLPRVPNNIVGMTQAAATAELTSRGLVVGTVTQQASTSVAAGLVISSTPGPNTQVAVGSAVNLVVSTGAPPSSGGGGGGGSTGLLEILGGLGLLGFARRRKAKTT